MTIHLANPTAIEDDIAMIIAEAREGDQVADPAPHSAQFNKC
jgi:hypothetical protein